MPQWFATLGYITLAALMVIFLLFAVGIAVGIVVSICDDVKKKK